MAAARRLFDERGADVPLDEIAKAGGVANATLYRHFATRAELLVEVYAEEVAQLKELGERLLLLADTGEALAEWLRGFVHHVATKRELALALPADGDRGALFDEWHATMEDAASQLVDRAREAGAIRTEVKAADLLALAAGVALTGLPDAELDALLKLVQHGYRA